MTICLKEFGVVCTLGQSKQAVMDNLLASHNDKNINFLVCDSDLPLEDAQFVGRVPIPNNENIGIISTRNNQLAYMAYCQIASTLEPLIKQYGQDRVAVVIGTSTAGTFEGEQARKALARDGEYPKEFHYEKQEMAAPSQYIADLCQAKGPVYSVSTACSSSGKVLVSAQALLESGLADVVVAGGVDSLTQLTTNGFKSLESIAKTQCQPFGKNRDGINIGEAAALFIVCKGDDVPNQSQQKTDILLLGTGETSDAYHMSAPAPDGDGAFRAMQCALDKADIKGEQVDYVNLHGTGTIKNDQMEAQAMAKACGEQVLCGSTKRLTGHTLGAAGALEVGLCWLLLSDYNKDNFIPGNVLDGELDNELAKINFSKGQCIENVTYCMSNSFAFGGNNFSAVLGRTSC